jgi:hypothetical protein
MQVYNLIQALIDIINLTADYFGQQMGAIYEKKVNNNGDMCIGIITRFYWKCI